ETYRTPYTEPGHGPHHFNASGNGWFVFDESGSGYFIVGDQGQYPRSRGAEPFFYITRHQVSEGDTDMGAIGTCCQNNHIQGPQAYLNDEHVAGENIVLWYVAQMLT